MPHSSQQVLPAQGFSEEEGQRTPAWPVSAFSVSLLGSEVTVCPEGWASSFVSRQQALRAWGGERTPSRELSVARTNIPTSASCQVARQPVPQGPAGHHVGCQPVLLLMAPENSSECWSTAVPTPRGQATPRASWGAVRLDPAHPQRRGS